MFQTFKKLYGLLDLDDRRNLFTVFIAMTVLGGLELIGISLIFPFISVLANPQVIHTNKYLNLFYNFFSFSSQNSYLIFLGVGVVCATTFSSMFNIFTQYKIVKFSELSSSKMACGLLSNYINRPYSFFLLRNSADLAKNILSEVSLVTVGVLLPALNAASRLVLLTILFTFVLWFDYKAAITVVSILGGSYFFIYLVIKNKLNTSGKLRLEANKNKYQIIAKAFGGIKEIKLFNNGTVFLNDFKKYFDIFARLQVENQLYGSTPRYILEVVAVGIVIAFILFSSMQHGDISTILPKLGLFALVGYKCLPALQIVYNSITRIKFHSATVDVLYGDMLTECESEIDLNPNGIQFNLSLKLKEVMFAYEGSSKNLFENINLEIKANSMVAFVGSTGAGKTTIVDILLGLLRPGGGEVIIDGIKLTKNNLKTWQKMIGYVPQRVYLSDDSVLKNIAFGVPENEIDHEKAHACAKIAQIHDFITSELQLGYESNIGERGVRLSGGQSQRIGIARALYRNPAVLVLDEATSALDNITETEVLEAIKRSSENRTIIMIAHRLTTVKDCDKIFLLKNGIIKAQGTFADLEATSDDFKRLQGHKIEPTFGQV